MFFLKKILSRFLFPAPLCFGILSIGLLLLWFTKRQKAGRTVVMLAGVLLFLYCSRFTSELLLTPLETKYAPLFTAPDERAPAGLSEAKFIVVLASGFSHEPERPVTVQLDEGSIVRLVEGVRLSKVLNCCKLVLSGGPGQAGAPSEADDMAQLAQELGVPRREMILDTNSRDTETEARHVAPIVGRQTFILVTEASHMPRAMGLFKGQGTHPIADPVDFRTTPSHETTLGDLFPGGGALVNSERAVYEYLGLALERMLGKM